MIALGAPHLDRVASAGQDDPARPAPTASGTGDAIPALRPPGVLAAGSGGTVGRRARPRRRSWKMQQADAERGVLWLPRGFRGQSHILFIRMPRRCHDRL